jgi:hypothetical protein
MYYEKLNKDNIIKLDENSKLFVYKRIKNINMNGNDLNSRTYTTQGRIRHCLNCINFFKKKTN